jgi:hypothetical protein
MLGDALPALSDWWRDSPQRARFGPGKHAPPAVVVLLDPQYGRRCAEVVYPTYNRLAAHIEDDDLVAYFKALPVDDAFTVRWWAVADRWHTGGSGARPSG